MPGAPADPPSTAGTPIAPGGWQRAAWAMVVGALWGALVARQLGRGLAR